MKRALLQGEIVVKKWGTLTLTNHRLWIEAGDNDNYFMNSVDLHRIDGHAIVKYSNANSLYMGVFCFFFSPISALAVKLLLKEISQFWTINSMNSLASLVAFAFFMFGANFIYKYRESRTLTLNFHAGHKQIYFKLTGEYAKLEQALEFGNLVDAEIKKLSTFEAPHVEEKKFKIVD